MLYDNEAQLHLFENKVAIPKKKHLILEHCITVFHICYLLLFVLLVRSLGSFFILFR